MMKLLSLSPRDKVLLNAQRINEERQSSHLCESQRATANTKTLAKCKSEETQAVKKSKSFISSTKTVTSALILKTLQRSATLANPNHLWINESTSNNNNNNNDINNNSTRNNSRSVNQRRKVVTRSDFVRDVPHRHNSLPTVLVTKEEENDTSTEKNTPVFVDDIQNDHQDLLKRPAHRNDSFSSNGSFTIVLDASPDLLRGF